MIYSIFINNTHSYKKKSLIIELIILHDSKEMQFKNLIKKIVDDSNNNINIKKILITYY